MARHLLVTNDYPPKTGGIQVYLHELWRRLEDGRSVVLTATSHEDAATFDRESTVVVERIDAATLYLPTPRVRRSIEEAIARHQPDLVLLDPAWPLGLLGPSLSVPYGVILHGAEVTIPGRLPLISSSLRYVLRHAVVAVAAGRYCENEARRCAGEFMPPVIQVPPGVDVSRFVPLTDSQRKATREKYGLPTNKPVVLSYSRLVPRKGMDTLIRASALLQEAGVDCQIAIGGAGRDLARLQKLTAKLSAPVTFLGRISDDDLPLVVGSADVLVMDCRSRWWGLEQEGFGIVFVEAAATGIPQIAGRSGGSHEAVHDGVTGLIVNHPRRPRELALAIGDVVGDSDWRASAAVASRTSAVTEFSWDGLAARLSEGLDAFDGPLTYDEGDATHV